MANVAAQPARVRADAIPKLSSIVCLHTIMKIPIPILTVIALPCCAFAADLTSAWKAECDKEIGIQKYTFTLKQDATNLTGKANSEKYETNR